MYRPVCESKGLIVGYTHMLYEEQILTQLEEKGFQRDKVVRFLDANKHNHETTCYYLILKKLERAGKIDKRKYFSGQHFLNNISVSNSQNQMKGTSDNFSGKKSVQLRELNRSVEENQLTMEKQYLSEEQRDQKNKMRQ